MRHVDFNSLEVTFKYMSQLVLRVGYSLVSRILQAVRRCSVALAVHYDDDVETQVSHTTRERTGSSAAIVRVGDINYVVCAAPSPNHYHPVH